VTPETDAERAAERAARLLDRTDAWLSEEAAGYAVRPAADRRRRPLMRLDEAAFRRLVRAPGLKPRTGGGWTLAGPAAVGTADRSGRPSVIEGERATADDDGVVRRRRANLGESPIAWLARRTDAQGRPWLTPAEAAAGEKLREDFHLAGTIGRMTMAWDAAPRGRTARGPGLDPAQRGVEAKARVAAALEAVGPGLREMLEQVCLRCSALDAAERGLGLPRRSGKTVLKLALQRLAAHYRIG
jgi:hypothetical protein